MNWRFWESTDDKMVRMAKEVSQCLKLSQKLYDGLPDFAKQITINGITYRCEDFENIPMNELIENGVLSIDGKCVILNEDEIFELMRQCWELRGIKLTRGD